MEYVEDIEEDESDIEDTADWGGEAWGDPDGIGEEDSDDNRNGEKSSRKSAFYNHGGAYSSFPVVVLLQTKIYWKFVTYSSRRPTHRAPYPCRLMCHRSLSWYQACRTHLTSGRMIDTKMMLSNVSVLVPEPMPAIYSISCQMDQTKNHLPTGVSRASESSNPVTAEGTRRKMAKRNDDMVGLGKPAHRKQSDRNRRIRTWRWNTRRRGRVTCRRACHSTGSIKIVLCGTSVALRAYSGYDLVQELGSLCLALIPSVLDPSHFRICSGSGIVECCVLISGWCHSE